MNETLFNSEIKKENELIIDKYLLQIHQSKLLDYIYKGIIAPDKYFNDDIEEDIQSQNKNFLLISDGYFNELSDDIILVELILTNIEKEVLKELEDNICLLDKPLPITRIKNIFCKNKKIVSEDITRLLKTYNAGFISKELFITFPKGKKSFKKKSELSNINSETDIKNFEEKLSKFDKIMGMFSFIKNSNLYYTNSNNIYSNYSDNYFKIFNYKTNKVEIKEWIENSFNYSKNSSAKELIKKINTDKYINDDFIEEGLKNISDENIKNNFQKLLNDPLAKKEILKLFESEENEIYYFTTLLYIYGKKGSNAKEIFKSNIMEEIPLDKIEKALFLFGLYYGYSRLKAFEEIKIENKEYQKLNTEDFFNIKFKLDSKLDYQIIESIYQYSFNSNDINKQEVLKFDYLDEINIKYKDIKFPNNKGFNRWYKIEKEKIFDVYNFKIKKETWEELIVEKLKKYPLKVEAKYKIFSYIYEKYNYLIEFYISSNKYKKNEFYFYRDDFIEEIKKGIDLKEQNKLLDSLENDKK